MRNLLLLVALAVPLAVAPAQQDSARTAVGGLHWGPRFGLTFLSDAVVAEADRKGVDVGSIISQVGWSWEQRFIIGPDSPMPMTQFVLLVGGAEQGVFLPSLSWLIGIRGIGGGEFGFGPNVSLTGASMAVAAGVSERKGALTIPFTIAMVFGDPGVRASVLFGFNMQRDK